MANSIKLKVIFVEQKKKDGTAFTKMMTILKGANGEKDKWVNIKFGDGVNTKLWKNKNQIIEVENKIMADGTKNIRIPKDFNPYTYKGKTIYPYVYIQEVKTAEEYHYTPNKDDLYVDAESVAFAMDEPDTTPVSTNAELNDIEKDLPF